MQLHVLLAVFHYKKRKKKDGRWYPEFSVSTFHAVFSAVCEEACPTTAIQMTPDFELAEYVRQDLVYEKENLSFLAQVNILTITSTVSLVWQ